MNRIDFILGKKKRKKGIKNNESLTPVVAIAGGSCRRVERFEVYKKRSFLIENTLKEYLISRIEVLGSLRSEFRIYIGRRKIVQGICNDGVRFLHVPETYIKVKNQKLKIYVKNFNDIEASVVVDVIYHPIVYKEFKMDKATIHGVVDIVE